ncbi:MFS general substrate transporter [Saccharata proteae CBS 121410]|uniref:MFS general substrate transporter n=1 Tax=Saccharata proteae CBS 121410 TaxID=1314787 RepID=A0A6A5YDB9_9PEZI|nr:MFS general substrate transporter [Saccharata proteae CBS 121410]
MFRSKIAEIAFVICMSMTQLLAEYLISGFGVILPYLVKDLSSSESISMLWPTSVLTLVLASMTLPFARAVDIYGGYPIYMGGVFWLCLWSLICGYCRSEVMLDICRAMQGLALAAFQSAGFALIGSTYPVGKKRNVVLGVYGAMAPVGFFTGIAMSGLAVEYWTWPWYFWISSFMCGFALIMTYCTVPTASWSDRDKSLKMDWLGAITTSSGLFLLAYSLAASSHVDGGWKSVQVLVPFIVGIVVLASSVVVELKIAQCPLLPLAFFKPKRIIPFMLGTLFFYGTFGVFLNYSNFYMMDIMKGSALERVLWYSPFAICGFIVASVGGSILHAIPNTYLLLLSGAAWIIAPLLFAIADPDVTYWAYIFPSMVCGALGLDLTYTLSTVFFSTTQPTKYQGLAGAVCSVLINLGLSFSLALADIVNSQLSQQGANELSSYRCVFWYGFGSACIGFILCVLFVRIPKADAGMIEPVTIIKGAVPDGTPESTEHREPQDWHAIRRFQEIPKA